MEQSELFSILDSVESTNNYATALAHAGLAKHGQTWFANEQFGGKGQRGKSWKSAPGDNLIMTILINPPTVFKAKPFLLSALIANECRQFLMDTSKEEFLVKWPNDIYWHDGKAGGILIENIYKGSEWEWAALGIGININQIEFDVALPNPVSLKKITGNFYDPIKLAKQLHERIFKKLIGADENLEEEIIKIYNSMSYKF